MYWSNLNINSPTGVVQFWTQSMNESLPIWCIKRICVLGDSDYLNARGYQEAPS